MKQKLLNFTIALFSLPAALIRLHKAILRAKKLYAIAPERYYVLASSANSLIVTSHSFQRAIGRKPRKTKASTKRTRKASNESMYRDCYYFTPTCNGKLPANYNSLMRQKLLTYIRHHLFYIRTRRK